jgi:hypothetical protein
VRRFELQRNGLNKADGIEFADIFAKDRLGQAQASVKRRHSDKARTQRQLRKEDKARDISRRQPRQFEEPSTAMFQAFEKRQNRGGHFRKKAPHPNKLRKERIAEEKKEAMDTGLVRRRNHLNRKNEKRERRRVKRQTKREETDDIILQTESGFMESVSNNLPHDSLGEIVSSLLSCDISGWAEDNVVVISTGLFVYQIYKSQNLVEATAAYGQYCLAVNGEISTKTMVWTGAMAAIATWINTRTPEEKLYAESLSEDAMSVMNFMRRKLKSEFVVLCTSLVSSLVAKHYFPESFTQSVKSFIGKPKALTGLGLLDNLCDIVIRMVKAVERYLAGDSFTESLFEDDPVDKAIASLESLMYYRDITYTGIPVEGYKDRREYLSELVQIYDTLKKLRELCNPLKKEGLKVNAAFSKASLELSRMRSMTEGQRRATPFAVMLYGNPGTGKSITIPYLFSLHARIKGRKFHDGMVFPKNPDDEYYEGHEPLSQPYLFFSEVGRKSKHLTASQGDSTLNEICSIIDSNPKLFKMAFDKKGEAYCQPEFVAGDTNNKNFWAKVLYSNPAAVYRRFIFVTQKVAPEYRKEGSCSLDPSKVGDIGILDPFRFTVEIREAQDEVKFNTITLCQEAGIEEFTDVMAELMTRHIRDQDRILERVRGDAFEPYLPDLKLQVESGELLYNSALKLWSLLVLKNTHALILLLWGFFMVHAQRLSKMTMSELFTFSLWRLMICMLLYCVDKKFFLPLFFINFAGIFSLMVRHRVSRQAQMYKNAITRRLWRYYYLFGGSYKSSRVAIAACGAAIVALLCFVRKRIRAIDMAPESGQLFEDIIGSRPNMVRVNIKHDSKIWNTRIARDPPVCTSSPEELDVCVRRNLRFCCIKEGNSIRKTHILGVTSNIALINRHALGGGECTIEVSSGGVIPAQREVHNDVVWYRTMVKPEDVTIVNDDLALVGLSGVLFKSDDRVLRHLLDEPVKGSVRSVINGCSVVSQYDESKASIVTAGGRKGWNIFSREDESFYVKHRYVYMWDAHSQGMCGLPLVAKIGRGAAIIGIHFAGAANNGSQMSAAIPLLSHELRNALFEWNNSKRLMPLHSESLAIPMISEELGEPSEKSIWRHEYIGGVDYYGKCPGNVNVNQKSKLRTLPGAEAAVDVLTDVLGQGPTQEFAPPLMKPRFDDYGNYLYPFNLGVKKLSGQRAPLDKGVLRHVCDIIRDRILDGVGGENIAPLTVEEAINGCVDNPFIRRLNCSTSPGYGKSGKKGDWLPIDHGVTRVPTEELKTEIQSVIQVYMDEGTYRPVYALKLKDEPREIEKVVIGKTRIFAVSPLAHLVVSRLATAPFYSLMQQFPEVFCTAIGINMHNGADRLYNHLTSLSSNIMEGDYGSFDQRMPFDIGHAAVTVISEVCEALGYNKSAMKILRGVLTDNMFPVCEVNKDIFCAPGYQPSGKYATAEDNSMRGIIMLMYAWYSLPATRDLDFFSHAVPVTYGDDVLVAISDEAKGLFNNRIYQSFCKSKYNIDYTSASKEQKMSPFVIPSEMSFLKRTFVYSEEFKQYIAPINANSLFKMVTWYIPSSAATEQEQLSSTLTSSLYELVLHISPREHAKVRRVYEAILMEVIGGFTPLPSYEQIVEDMFPSD